jgi:hypothetical protein
MNRDILTRVNRDAVLETLAAELTLAAYRVALRTTTAGIWLELELYLWRELADTARTWGATQQPTQLILAEADACDLLEVGCQPFGGPHRESVAQLLKIGIHCFFYSCPRQADREQAGHQQS